MSIEMIIAIAVMVLVLVGMLVVKKTMANSPMLQPLLFLCVAVELGLVGFVVYSLVGGGGMSSDTKNRIEMQARREESKGFAAAKALPKGKKAALIVNPGNKENMFIKRLKAAFEKEYGGTLEVVELEFENMLDGSDITITAKDVDKVLAKVADAEFILFYDTFPVDYSKLSTKSKADVKYFLFGTGGADGARLAKEIKAKNSKISGILLSRRNTKVKHSDPVEKDLQQAFDKRYIIITGANVDANFNEYFK